jgi:hypothetical protein
VSPVKYEMGVYIPEDDILHSHRRENVKSYIVLRCSVMEIGSYMTIGRPLLSNDQSSWLQIQRSRVRFPAPPNLLRSYMSGTVHSAS